VTGLKAIPPTDRPPVNLVFQSYHAMVGIGIALILLSFWSIFAFWRGTLEKNKFLLGALVASVLGPQLANQLGWLTAEVGRQPWIVYHLMRTSEGLSKSVKAGQVVTSIVMFGFIYAMLFVLFVFLLDQKIKHGPEDKVHPSGRADL
jgi:cytochrome d ubiquinol oxidase subunit I